ncbi:MAG TPA: hypothetical protein VF868_13210 [Bacteroidia bacterium]
MAVILFHLAGLNSSAQGEQFSVKLKMQAEGGNLENALITITKNGKPDRVIDPSKGKYNIDLDLGAEYTLVFTKMGYVSKTIIIDTHVPNGRENAEFGKFSATVELAKQPEDKVITYTQPVGRIKYSTQLGDFDYDKDYTATAEAMIRKAESNPIPKPKTPPPPPPVSNPVPVEIKQPEYKPEPPKVKPVVTTPEVPVKTVVRNKEEKTTQEDRRKITVIIVNIDGVDYVYRREHYSWGGLYFYKNGKNITESTFERETE